MNEKCHRTKSYLSVTLPNRCNSYVSQVSQKEKCSFCVSWLTLELHLYGSVTERKLFVLWHFLFIETFSMSPLKKTPLYSWFCFTDMSYFCTNQTWTKSKLSCPQVLIGRQQVLQQWALGQTWNLSQAPQTCLCQIILVWVKSFAKHTIFLSQFGLVCVKILRVEVTRVSSHYK